jgi:Flp pilus assembly pilin Flp
MRILKKGILGQNILEVALLLTLITAAMTAIHLYVKRSLQARYKGGIDSVFSEIDRGGVSVDSRQYVPYYLQRYTNAAEAIYEKVEGFPHSSIRMNTTTSGNETIDSIIYAH